MISPGTCRNLCDLAACPSIVVSAPSWPGPRDWPATATTTTGRNFAVARSLEHRAPGSSARTSPTATSHLERTAIKFYIDVDVGDGADDDDDDDGHQLAWSGEPVRSPDRSSSMQTDWDLIDLERHAFTFGANSRHRPSSFICRVINHPPSLASRVGQRRFWIKH